MTWRRDAGPGGSTSVGGVYELSYSCDLHSRSYEPSCRNLATLADLIVIFLQEWGKFGGLEAGVYGPLCISSKAGLSGHYTVGPSCGEANILLCNSLWHPKELTGCLHYLLLARSAKRQSDVALHRARVCA